jgi:ribose 5-phosphate isomerase
LPFSHPKAVVAHINDGDVVGIGSGSTIVFAVEKLRQRVTVPIL